MGTLHEFFGIGNIRILRVLLVGDFLTGVSACLVSIFVDPRLLPADLRDYTFSVPKDYEIDEQAVIIIVACVVGLFVTLMLAVLVGLWRLRPWGRLLYVLFALISTVWPLVAFAEPVLYTGLSLTLWSISGMISGGILLLVLVILRDEFRRGSNR